MQSSPPSVSDVNKEHTGATSPVTHQKRLKTLNHNSQLKINVAFPLGGEELSDQCSDPREKDVSVLVSIWHALLSFHSPPPSLCVSLTLSLSASSARRPLSSMSLRLTNCTSLSFDYTSKSSLSRLRRIYQEATLPFEENIAAQRQDDARPKPNGWHYNGF